MNEFVSEYEDQIARFVDAIAWGLIADQAFQEACAEVGLDPARHYDSPLLALAAATAGGAKQ